MTHKKWSIGVVLLMISLQWSLFSCKKSPDATNADDFSGLYECHNLISWDSTKMNQALIGTWNWQFIGCYFKTKIESFDTYKGFSVEFKADHTLITRQDGINTDTASWHFIPTNFGGFTLETVPSVGQLWGIVLFCDDRVEFADGYVDGCDNYFIRKK